MRARRRLAPPQQFICFFKKIESGAHAGSRCRRELQNDHFCIFRQYDRNTQTQEGLAITVDRHSTILVGEHCRPMPCAQLNSIFRVE